MNYAVTILLRDIKKIIDNANNYEYCVAPVYANGVHWTCLIISINEKTLIYLDPQDSYPDQAPYLSKWNQFINENFSSRQLLRYTVGGDN